MRTELIKENGETFLVYNGLKLVYEGKSYPGGGHLNTGNYSQEIEMFEGILDNVRNPNPIMFELGCHWAFWSLLFKQRYPTGSNVIVDIGKNQLSTGIRNFELNKFEPLKAYHGAFFREFSETYEKKDTQLVEGVGEDLDFFKVFKQQKVKDIDLLHMDIQGSELVFIQNVLPFLESKKIQNIVICTHDHLVPPLHKKIIEILYRCQYKVKIDINSLNHDDGYIYASSL